MKFKTLWLSGAACRTNLSFWLSYLPSSRGCKSIQYAQELPKLEPSHKALLKQTSCLKVSSIASFKICRSNQNLNLKKPDATVWKRSIVDFRKMAKNEKWWSQNRVYPRFIQKGFKKQHAADTVILLFNYLCWFNPCRSTHLQGSYCILWQYSSLTCMLYRQFWLWLMLMTCAHLSLSLHLAI